MKSPASQPLAEPSSSDDTPAGSQPDSRPGTSLSGVPLKHERLWALHDFEAENEDELSFFAGEEITVVEDDSEFGDGWYKGRNERGEIGLFPKLYTSETKPLVDEDGMIIGVSEPASSSPVQAEAHNASATSLTIPSTPLDPVQEGDSVPSTRNPSPVPSNRGLGIATVTGSGSGSHTPVDGPGVMTKTLSEVQSAIDSLLPNSAVHSARNSYLAPGSASGSIAGSAQSSPRSQNNLLLPPEVTNGSQASSPTPGSAAWAASAHARAREVLARKAAVIRDEEEEEQEKERQLDEDHKRRLAVPPISGMELSDESEEEDDEDDGGSLDDVSRGQVEDEDDGEGDVDEGRRDFEEAMRRHEHDMARSFSGLGRKTPNGTALASGGPTSIGETAPVEQAPATHPDSNSNVGTNPRASPIPSQDGSSSILPAGLAAGAGAVTAAAASAVAALSSAVSPSPGPGSAHSSKPGTPASVIRQLPPPGPSSSHGRESPYRFPGAYADSASSIHTHSRNHSLEPFTLSSLTAPAASGSQAATPTPAGPAPLPHSETVTGRRSFEPTPTPDSTMTSFASLGSEPGSPPPLTATAPPHIDTTIPPVVASRTDHAIYSGEPTPGTPGAQPVPPPEVLPLESALPAAGALMSSPITGLAAPESAKEEHPRPIELPKEIPPVGSVFTSSPQPAPAHIPFTPSPGAASSLAAPSVARTLSGSAEDGGYGTPQPGSMSSRSSSRAETGLGAVGTRTGTATGTSVTTAEETNEREEKVQSHPNEWSVEDVVEWGKGKGFDAVTLAKFKEHEISGDVLMEMDVNTLKEIDIPAFGRRVHIYNGIKELKRIWDAPAQLSTPNTAPSYLPQSHTPSHSISGSAPPHVGGYGRAAYASPSLSGYEPDSPASGAFSVRDRDQYGHGGLSHHQLQQSLSQAQMQGQSLYAHELQRSASTQGTGNERLEGLGFAAAGAAAAGAAGPVSIPTRQGSVSSAHGSPRRVPPRPLTADDAVGRRAAYGDGHRRVNTTATSDSYATDHDYSGPFNELDEDGQDGGQNANAAPTQSKRSSLLGALQRPRSANSIPTRARSGSEQDLDTEKTQSATTNGNAGDRSSYNGRPSLSTPSSPNTPRSDGSFKEKSRFLSLTRGRKPPPKMPSDSEDGFASSSPRPSVPPKRGTRLFPMGSSSQSISSSVHPGTNMKASISSPLEAGGAALVASPEDPSRNGRFQAGPRPPAKGEKKGAEVGGANVPLRTKLKEIVHEGRLRKKGERYNTWKSRYLFLDLNPVEDKNEEPWPYLYVTKDYDAIKPKAIIELHGYKVIPIADEPGCYGFKLLHATKEPHSFSSEDRGPIKSWMSELTKATVSRDYSKPVIASSNIPTIPLAVAQTMNPPPRPPSPTSVSALQRKHLVSDAEQELRLRTTIAASQGMQKSRRDSVRKEGLYDAPPKQAKRESLRPSKSVKRKQVNSGAFSGVGSDDTAVSRSFSSQQKRPSTGSSSRKAPASAAPPPLSEEESALLAWINSHLPPTTPAAQDLSTGLRSGEVLARLVESLSDVPEESRIPKDVFQLDTNGNISLGGIFHFFDLLIDNEIHVEEVSPNDVSQGDREKIKVLVLRIREHFAA